MNKMELYIPSGGSKFSRDIVILSSKLKICRQKVIFPQKNSNVVNYGSIKIIQKSSEITKFCIATKMQNNDMIEDTNDRRHKHLLLSLFIIIIIYLFRCNNKYE